MSISLSENGDIVGEDGNVGGKRKSHSNRGHLFGGGLIEELISREILLIQLTLEKRINFPLDMIIW